MTVTFPKTFFDLAFVEAASDMCKKRSRGTLMRATDDVTFVQSMRNSRPHIQNEPRVCKLKLNSSAGRCFEFLALIKQKQDSCLLSCFVRCTVSFASHTTRIWLQTSIESKISFCFLFYTTCVFIQVLLWYLVTTVLKEFLKCLIYYIVVEFKVSICIITTLCLFDTLYVW